MNIFEQYGIKEVADVTLYSIELDENDDEVYIPVLYLDTLKVSTVEETAEQTSARGGLGNPELIIWDYGKEITVTLEDALYTPASMGMTWGGKHGTKKFELYGNYYLGETPDVNNPDGDGKGKIIVESYENFSLGKQETSEDVINYHWKNCRISFVSENNVYRYSIDDGDIYYYVSGEAFKGQIKIGDEDKAAEYISFNKEGDVPLYFVIDKQNGQNNIVAQEMIYQIDHALNNVKYLDRMEKCKASHQFCINTDTNTAHANYRYLQSYNQTELTVFIDPRTMQPYEPNTDTYTCKDGAQIEGNLRVFKQHEIYYKWTRSKAPDYTTLGHQILVDAIHFPGTYRLVGETYSRSRSTGKDERFQFEIPLCKMGTENSFTLEAEGDPTTFNMTLKVLRREDGVMMKLTQYEVEDAKYGDYTSGSTVVVPDAEVVPESPIPNDGIT